MNLHAVVAGLGPLNERRAALWPETWKRRNIVRGDHDFEFPAQRWKDAI